MIKTKLITVVIITILSLIMFSAILPNTAHSIKAAQAQAKQAEVNATTTTEAEDNGGESKQDELAPPDEDVPLPGTLGDLAVAVTYTISLLESGGTGDCNTPGLSGERGCHQYLPSTWVSYSTEILGYEADQTPELATYVTYQKVLKWLEAGKTPRDIFLIWNQGNDGPCKSGYNKYNVYYDSCGYVDRALMQLAEVIN